MNKIKEKIIDLVYDYKYNVKTCGDEEFDRRIVNFGYKPTSYIKLHEIFRKYSFNKGNHLIDYGCGKGRVLFVAAKNGCNKVTGVEIDKDMYIATKNNIDRFQSKHKNSATSIELVNQDAMKYEVDPSVTDFFFYNPFHMKIFVYVLKKIEKSAIDFPRYIRIFLVHPDKSTLWLLGKMQHFVLLEQSEKYRYVVYCTKEESEEPRAYLKTKIV